MAEDVTKGGKVAEAAKETPKIEKGVEAAKDIPKIEKGVTTLEDAQKAVKAAEAEKAIEGVSDFGKYSTKIDNKVTVIDKQQIPNWLGKTFKNGNYRTVVTNEEITVYRSFGYNADAGGAFATSSSALNRMMTKVNSAILPPVEKYIAIRS